MRNLSRMLAATVLVAAALLLLPATTPAATVSVDTRFLLFTADPGEVNDTTIHNFVTPQVITDLGAPLVAGPGCRQATPFGCDIWFNQTAFLGDRNDKARLVSFGSSTVYGEAGNDTLANDGEVAWAYGGPGADQIRVTGNHGVAHGGPGRDQIQGGGNYASNLYGEEGKDVLTETRHGSDCSSLDGGSGSDRLLGYACARLTGGPGSDVITVYLSGEGSDRAGRFDGGPGRDFIVGGLGPDQIDAGPGRDFIQAAADGAPDTILCGTGRDTVRANPADTVAADCENVTIIARDL